VKDENYIATMDLFPQQVKEHNKLYPFYDALKANRLTTTRCRKCNTLSWPPRTICPECVSADLEWVDLPSTGKIEIYTVEVVGTPVGFNNPLLHALVKMDGSELTLFSQIVDAKVEQLSEGMKVGLRILEIDRDRVSFAFGPV
jgi:uncharacterized OB-fold protein